MTRRGRVAVAGALVLLVGAGSCESGTTPGTDDGGGDMSQTGSILATVTSDGEPASGVDVSLFDEGGDTALETGTTDASGEYAFTELEPATYEVEVMLPSGYELSAGAQRQTADVTAGEESTVSYALTDTTGSGSVQEIHLTAGLAFSPSEVTIEPGTTVRWVNDADIFHTITPDGHSEWARQEMDTTGETFEHTFDAEGTYPYYCEPHESQGMTGTITVQSP